MPRLLDALREHMSDQEENRPGHPAPATAHFEELDIFGNLTGGTANVREGDSLPGAPRGLTWRRIRRAGHQ